MKFFEFIQSQCKVKDTKPKTFPDFVASTTGYTAEAKAASDEDPNGWFCTEADAACAGLGCSSEARTVKAGVSVACKDLTSVILSGVATDKI